MRRWDNDRWEQLADGSFIRRRELPEDVVTYGEMTKAELVEELEARGLSKAGNKDELIERLLEDDDS